MSSYETAIARIYALGHELAQTPSHKFDLAHMRVLLAALDNPERRFPSVLIAGTNGKGSTASTLASILRASGLRTGLYTSPHLVRINERIRIGGQQIGDDDFALIHELVDRLVRQFAKELALPIASQTKRRHSIDHLLHRRIRHPCYQVGNGRTEHSYRFQYAFSFFRISAPRRNQRDNRYSIRCA